MPLNITTLCTLDRIWSILSVRSTTATHPDNQRAGDTWPLHCASLASLGSIDIIHCRPYPTLFFKFFWKLNLVILWVHYSLSHYSPPTFFSFYREKSFLVVKLSFSYKFISFIHDREHVCTHLRDSGRESKRKALLESLHVVAPFPSPPVHQDLGHLHVHPACFRSTRKGIQTTSVCFQLHHQSWALTANLNLTY